jgi:hypothetical protein
MSQPRYQDFLDDLARGVHHGVFIDDTGSPGLATPDLRLHPERSSWVAVIVPRSDMSEVLEQFPEALDELSRLAASNEFHFGDIYGGRREFRDVPLAVRLALFEFMATIFRTYRFPVIVQTLDPDSLGTIRGRGKFPDSIGPFNLSRPVDTALFFLLLRVKWYLQDRAGPGLARIFVDEGYKNNSIAIRIPTFEKVFAGGLICFAKSSTIHPIQLADFAAFCMNRTQLLLAKAELSHLDAKLLEILSPIAWNYVNIEKQVASLEDWPNLTREE